VGGIIQESRAPLSRYTRATSSESAPWRDLPAYLGKWNSVFKRYRDWVKAGVFVRLFEACSDEPAMEYAMIDATIVKVHRHGQGAKGGHRAKRSAAPKVA
jgi:transposase